MAAGPFRLVVLGHSFRTIGPKRCCDQEACRRILATLFGQGGESVWMQPPFYCDYDSNILLGERVFFNFYCAVLDVCAVKIGDFMLFGPAVQVYTASPGYRAHRQGRRVLRVRAGVRRFLDMVIERDGKAMVQRSAERYLQALGK
jgi:acetyltransferase-like isoleucine patch superfamily enzyme